MTSRHLHQDLDPDVAGSWSLDQTYSFDEGDVRWRQLGARGAPIVLIHGTPYSSLLWRDIAPALASTRRVFVLDHLGYGQSEMRAGQDLTIAAQARRLAQLLRHWDLGPVSVAANDVGGAITLRAMLLEHAHFSDLTLFDCVSGGEWEVGLFAQLRANPELFAELPGYAHRALVTSHLRNATYAGYRPGVLQAYLQPWLGADGQAAFYRQYRQLAQRDTDDYAHLLADISIPVRLLWGRQDRIVPPPFAHWLADHVPHQSLTWIDNAGHLLQEDAPAQLTAALLDH